LDLAEFSGDGFIARLEELLWSGRGAVGRGGLNCRWHRCPIKVGQTFLSAMNVVTAGSNSLPHDYVPAEGGASSRTKWPLRPPAFSSKRMLSITIPRSIDLHIS